jgi:hypothetical protein
MRPSPLRFAAATAADREERRDLHRLLRRTAVFAAGVVAAVTLLPGSAMLTRSADWRLLLYFWWPFLVAPPVASIALIGVAALMGLGADRLPSRPGRWTRRAALALGFIALFVVALEVLLTIAAILALALGP